MDTATGARASARIFYEGFSYVPESELDDAITKMIDAEEKLEERVLSRDGFICSPDHALDCAYLLNLGNGLPREEVAEILAAYVDGDISIEEACNSFKELIDDAI